MVAAALLLTASAILSVSAAEPSDYDGRSWVDGPVVLVADVSGVEARQPGAGLFAAIARARGDGVSGIYFSPRISATQGFARQFGFAGSRQAAAVIRFHNRPRLTRLTPGRAGVVVTGTSNRFFVRRLWMEIDGPGGRERVRVPVRGQWRVRVPMGGDERMLALVYRPRGGAKRVVAVRRALRE